MLSVDDVSASVFVCLVDQDAADAAFRNRNRQRGADRMILWIVPLLLLGERQKLASAWIVDFDARSLAAAAGGIDQFCRSGPGLFGQTADSELLATGIE